MLLRSSSSPLFADCVATQTEAFPDARFESFSSPTEALHRSRSSNHAAILPHPRLHLDSPMASMKLPEQLAASSDSPGYGFPSSCRMRKVLSEGDLSTLGRAAGSASPVQLAAHTLLQEPGLSSRSASDSSSSLLKKDRVLLPLCRQMSLGSLPSELPSVCFHDGSVGNGSAILEENEPSSSCSSCTSEVDRTDCSFDKIALPVGKLAQASHRDPQVLCRTDEERRPSVSLLEKEISQELGGSNKSTQGYMVASLSGRHSQVGELTQCHSQYDMARNGNVCTIERICQTKMPPRDAFSAENLETTFGGGGYGGSDGRPPITGGGGGDAGSQGGSSDVADQHYQRVLQRDPGNPLLLRNYAQYLSDVKHEHSKAEEFYQRAILASPGDGELLGQYAKMLWEVRHDAERAAMYFERAVQSAPDNSYVVAAYASFLWSSEDEQETGGSSSSEFPATFPSLVSVGHA